MILDSTAWNAAGWTMLHLAWIGTLIGLAAVIVRRLARSARPETRYGLALACLVALALAPVVIFTWVLEPATSQPIPRSTATESTPEVAAFSTRIDTRGDSGAFSQELAVRPPASRSSRSGLSGLVTYLPAVWAVGSSLTLLLLAAGLIGVERLRRSSRILVDGPVAERCRALANSLGMARKVGVGSCDRLAGPILIGILRPLILLPPAALAGWSADQLEMVLLHELAHLRRWDNLVNLGQRAVEALLFFQPVTWWLSGWVRLERELCCDRMVIERTGRPSAYAQILLTLTGAHPRGIAAISAMADRRVLSRIRWILDLEDRSMKLTMPEGLGLVGAFSAVVFLIAGVCAAPPSKQTDEATREALRHAAEQVLTTTIGPNEPDMRATALLKIADTQLKRGDRTAGLKTLERASGLLDKGRMPNDGWEMLVSIVQVSRAQREAGDTGTARKTLESVTRAVDALKPAKKEEVIEVAGREVTLEVGDFIPAERNLRIAGERLDLGDKDEAIRLTRRAVVMLRPATGIIKVAGLSLAATQLHRAGAHEEAKALIEEAERAWRQISSPAQRDFLSGVLAQSLVEIGSVEESTKVVQSLGGSARHKALQGIIESLGEDESQNPSLDMSGIKIIVGAGWLKLKEPATARKVLPEMARAVHALGDPLVVGRTLSQIAHLQAKAGDFAGALATVEMMPDLRRKDYPGPSEGFYDSIKPATLALIAECAADSGNEATARQAFDRAIALSRAIPTDGEKSVAQIVIAQTLAASGQIDRARSVLREAIPLAIRLPEPRRSRSLAMLVECQIRAQDQAGAAETAEAIRAYPGQEQVRSLNALAFSYEEAGNRADASRFLRKALECIEAKPPAKVAPGPVKQPGPIGAHDFIDPDFEFDPRFMDFQRQTLSISLRVRLGDTDGALRLVQSLPEAGRGFAFRTLIGAVASQGKLVEALKLAETIKKPEDRLAAIQTACFLVSRDVKSRRDF